MLRKLSTGGGNSPQKSCKHKEIIPVRLCMWGAVVGGGSRVSLGQGRDKEEMLQWGAVKQRNKKIKLACAHKIRAGW